MNQAIKLCKVQHFPNDTNLLNYSKYITKLNKLVNIDMRNVTDWLNANKISLDVQKTELVIFKHLRKQIDSEVKIKLSRKQFYSTDSVKCCGIRTDENLKRNHHVNDIAIKLKIKCSLF